MGGGRFVVVGGNQRLLVCRELGYTQMPVKIIPQETSAKTLMRIAMLDNEEFGKTDWEAIRGNWDCEELKDWGVLLPVWEDETTDNQEKKNVELQEYTKIEVDCANEAEQQLLYNELTERGFLCRVLTF